MNTKTIEITQKDIEKGVKSSAARCPVALAIMRAFDCENVIVFKYIQVEDNICIETPPNVFKWLVDFDYDEEVEPFSFTVEYDEDNN